VDSSAAISSSRAVTASVTRHVDVPVVYVYGESDALETEPQLTTIDMNLEALGAAAARGLFTIIDGAPGAPPGRLVVGVEPVTIPYMLATRTGVRPVLSARPTSSRPATCCGAGHRVARRAGPAAPAGRQDRADRRPVACAGFIPAADPRRGRVAAHLACAIADGGEVMSGFRGAGRPERAVRPARLGAGHVADAR
jgi:hypothetical protein